MAAIKFSIDVLKITEDGFHQVISEVDEIAESTHATQMIGSSADSDSTVFVLLSFRKEMHEECAFILLNDLHSRYEFATSVETV